MQSKASRSSPDNSPVIRASEVGEYVYCARAWWLRRVAGVVPAHGQRRRARGVRAHRRHGWQVALSRVLLVAAVLLLLLAAVALVW